MVVKLLLDYGADVTMIDQLGKTPLGIAEEKGYSIIARMLREAEEKEYKKLYAKETKESNQKSEKILRRETSKPTIIKSDVDELPVMQAKPNKNAYAIVIGVEKYRQQLPKADYADNDARIMTEYLTKVMGYPEENVVTLTGEHATKSDFQKYIENGYQIMQKNAAPYLSIIRVTAHQTRKPVTRSLFHTMETPLLLKRRGIP